MASVSPSSWLYKSNTSANDYSKNERERGGGEEGEEERRGGGVVKQSDDYDTRHP